MIKEEKKNPEKERCRKTCVWQKKLVHLESWSHVRDIIFEGWVGTDFGVF
jgi:hypothetical protein